MKNSVPFEYFGENQFVYFDIERLAALEKLAGTSITVMCAGGGNTGVNFVLNACMVGLAHHYHKATKEDYRGFVEEYLETGGTLSKLEIDLSRAIVASGIYGKAAADKALGLIPDTKGEEKDPNGEKPVE